MSEYNIQMNKYNALNAEYDQLYPQPMKHASTHAKDGDDPITPSSIGAAELGADGKVLTSQLPSMEVDAYTKVQTLSDTTKTLFGLDATAVPDDVLSLIKTLIDNANASISTKAKIQTGSYVGTGTYGASNPCSLTFDFVPKFIFIKRIDLNEEDNYEHIFFCMPDTLCTDFLRPDGYAIIGVNSFTPSYAKAFSSNDKKTLNWSYEGTNQYENQTFQFNGSGASYRYYAFQ